MRNERNASIAINAINHRVMHAICACAVVLFSVLPASAQVYSTYQSSSAVVESDLQYQSYQSTVYAPFDNTMPSENTSLYQSPSNSDAGDRSNAPSNRRNVGGVQGDPGEQSPESPVGEAWVMLFFAAVAALVVFVRQRRAAELQA